MVTNEQVVIDGDANSKVESKPLDWSDGTFAILACVMVIGVISKYLMTNEPFNGKRFWGEILAALLLAFVLFIGGVLQGFSTLEILFFGGFTSLGMVRSFEWVIKILTLLSKGR